MNILHLSTRERTILVIFILVCCGYGMVALIYQPALGERERLENALRAAHKKSQEQAKVIARDQGTPEEFRALLENKLQKGADQEVLSGILTEIENAASAMNIRVVEMKPQAVVADKLSNRFSVNLSVDGSFKELVAFIHSLQAPAHDLDIAQCFLERPFGESSQLQAKLVVVRNLIRPEGD